MKVLGIIPARYASSRFPGKPLIDLKGKTMIQRVYEGAIKSKFINLLVVATDDTRIRDEVLRFGGNVEMTSEKHNSGTDRCAEVAKKYPEYDLIVNIQGDEPLVDFRQLDQLIQVFEKENIKIATLATKKITSEELENPNRIKIVVDKNDSALYFSRSAIPNQVNFKGDSIRAYPFLKHIGLYAYRRETLFDIANLPVSLLEKTESLEQLRWLYNGFSIHVAETDIETPNIDTMEDVEIVLRSIT
jgi:3-deoxy-manno-octulosonate cytidylyltransferase (CMP-KDO synthetase)